MYVHVIANIPWQGNDREYVLVLYESVFNEWLYRWEPRYRRLPPAIYYAHPERGYTLDTQIDTLIWGSSFAVARLAFDERTLPHPLPYSKDIIDWWTIPARTFP
jgi:hypothetical protein